MANTYILDRIADLLKVPSERREDCVRDILYSLSLAEFADVDAVHSFEWIDDG